MLQENEMMEEKKMNGIVNSVKEDLKMASESIANLEDVIATITGNYNEQKDSAPKQECLESDLAFLNDKLLRIMEASKAIRILVIGQNDTPTNRQPY